MSNANQTWLNIALFLISSQGYHHQGYGNMTSPVHQQQQQQHQQMLMMQPPQQSPQMQPQMSPQISNCNNFMGRSPPQSIGHMGGPGSAAGTQQGIMPRQNETNNTSDDSDDNAGLVS